MTHAIALTHAVVLSAVLTAVVLLDHPAVTLAAIVGVAFSLGRVIPKGASR